MKPSVPILVLILITSVTSWENDVCNLKLDETAHPLCFPYVQYNTFAGLGFSLNVTKKYMAAVNKTEFIFSQNNISSSEIECRKAITELVCVAYFPPCTFLGVEDVADINIPCQSMCESVKEACKGKLNSTHLIDQQCEVQHDFEPSNCCYNGT